MVDDDLPVQLGGNSHGRRVRVEVPPVLQRRQRDAIQPLVLGARRVWGPEQRPLPVLLRPRRLVHAGARGTAGGHARKGRPVAHDGNRPIARPHDLDLHRRVSVHRIPPRRRSNVFWILGDDRRTAAGQRNQVSETLGGAHFDVASLSHD